MKGCSDRKQVACLVLGQAIAYIKREEDVFEIEGVFFPERGDGVVLPQWQTIPMEGIMKAKTLWWKAGAMTIAAGFAVFGLPGICAAEDAPLSYAAEPAVYKLLAENELFRVVLATWKPGQRDAYHSHSANAAYRLTDCKNKVYRPDGSIAREGEVKAGTVALQNPIVSHSYENVSDHECQALIVERK